MLAPWYEMTHSPEGRRERWSECAAIMEMDGGLARDEAEHTAYLMINSADKFM
jgi:hypothetical protein